MKVCLYLEGEDWVSTSGFRTAFENHRRALELARVQVTLDPKDEYDVLHTHFFGPKSMFHIKQAQKRGLPAVCHAHSFGAHDFRDSFMLSNAVAPLYELYLRFYYNQADMVMTCSAYAKSAMEQSGVTTPIEVVSNGMDSQRFRAMPGSEKTHRSRMGLHRFTFFSAGNLIPRKGVNDFIDLAHALPQYDFVWFGKRWNKLLNANPDIDRALTSAPRNLFLPGFVSDTASAFSAMDALLFPSLTENQPMVILESATLGLPLIVRDLPEYQGFLTHGVNCLKARGQSDFVEMVKRVAEEPDLRARLIEGAAALANVHDLAHVGQRLKALYGLLVEKKELVSVSS